ncbi:MAG: urocanate hydratase [Vicinamibacteria bacterium]
MSASREVRAPRGTELSAKGWLQEAALRCLMNSLDPEVAEDPERLVIEGARGKPARSWESFDAILRSLRGLENDETLLVQSGKPVGALRTHPMSPRVLIVNGLVAGEAASGNEHRDLETAGLIMDGHISAGAWSSIGNQGALQGTYQTFAAIAEQRFGGTLKGKLTLTAGLGAMGGAQPLGVTMNEGVALVVEIDPDRITRRLEAGYLDMATVYLDEAIEDVMEAKRKGEALSMCVLGNAADIVPDLLKRGVEIDIVTDQTSAHDPLHGYVPKGLTCAEAAELRRQDPDGYVERARASIGEHCAAMVGFADRGAEVFDFGNNLRGEARLAGLERAFDYPGFVAYIRPLFCEGVGPLQWIALSGEPADIAVADRAVAELFPDSRPLHRWLQIAKERVPFQGLPARVCWLGYGERDKVGHVLNQLVRSGEVKAPIVVGRTHLDSGSATSPAAETEGMRDGSDSIADWPMLNALLNTASGAAWVAVHRRTGAGPGESIHAAAQVVADGTEQGAERLERVLTNDSAMGVLRLVDAGYERASQVARERGIRIPESDNP